MNKTYFHIRKIILLIVIIMTICSCKSNAVIKKEFDFLELKQMSNLATLEFKFNNIGIVSQEKKFLWIDTTRKAFVEYVGAVKVGIDFNELKYDNLTKTITIPRAKVLSIDDDANSYEYYTSDESILPWLKNEIKKERYNDLIIDSQKEMQKSVENNEKMLRQAQVLAKIQIENLINDLYIIGGKAPQIKYIFAND